MDQEEDADVFSEPDSSSNVDIREENEEEEEDEEENDAKIFNAWLSQYRAAERQKGKKEEEEQDEEPDRESRSTRKNSFDLPLRTRTDRRASLPCPTTLGSMQLSRLHSATKAPITARALLQRSSRSSSEDASLGPPERRPSLIPTIPEGVEQPERRTHFRRRNVMSLGDADSVCLICHDDLNKGDRGVRELQCSHSFHSECIEEWLWRKHACPTCRVQVVVSGMHWGSTRVKVP